MKIAKIAGGVLLALIVVMIGVAFLLPKEVTVERDIVINAPPAAVFTKLNSFKEFNTWSPWSERDPETKYTYTGPETGAGAAMSWNSDNPNVGSGSQKIVKSEPNTYIENELDFGDQGTGVAYFKLGDQGDKTKVTWGLKSDMGNNPIGRWMGLMMDTWIGADYEQGLSNLKSQIEKG